MREKDQLNMFDGTIFRVIVLSDLGTWVPRWDDGADGWSSMLLPPVCSSETFLYWQIILPYTSLAECKQKIKDYQHMCNGTSPKVYCRDDY